MSVWIPTAMATSPTPLDVDTFSVTGASIFVLMLIVIMSLHSVSLL